MNLQSQVLDEEKLILDKKLKLIVISHALVIPAFQNRWKRLAKEQGVEVHLFVPKVWIQTWFGEEVIYKTEDIKDANFNIHTFNTTSKKRWLRYFFKSIDLNFREINPDLIYVLHEEGAFVHHQVSLYKKLFARKSKAMFFSMNARGTPSNRSKSHFKRFIHKILWKDLQSYTEAALVHYPGCVDSLRKGGFDKPIFMQTQVGVDNNLFCPDEIKRIDTRKKLKLNDSFVIGYSGRLSRDKGVDDLVEVFSTLSAKYKDIHLLLVGNGELRNEIEKLANDRNLKDKITITGFVHQDEVPQYMRAMDLFVLGSRTKPHWVDTFPLVTVQAQASGVPVIASNSASIPWQLGGSALLYQEGNRKELEALITECLQGDINLTCLAEQGRNRSLEYFCHDGMNENFMKIACQVMSGNYHYHRKNEEYIQWKAV